MNPTWQVLKYFNEEQFFKIVQETSKKSNILGKLPRPLTLSSQQTRLLRNDSIASSISFQSTAGGASDSLFYRIERGCSGHLTPDYLHTKIH